MSDMLGREVYAKMIAEEIDNHYSRKDVTDNIIFAISGKWGEGKTDLLKQLRPLLVDKGFEVVEFNPWQYSREDSTLNRAFLRKLNEVLQSGVDLSDLYYDRTSTHVHPYFWTYLVVVAAVVGIVPGLWQSINEFILQYIVESPLGGIFSAVVLIALLPKLITLSRQSAKVTTAEEFENKFKDVISDKSKIVIFIDDLDRCNATTIRNILNALRTFFFHKECSYVITGDHTVIEKYAAQEIESQDTEEGRRFLKKLFDVYWRLPLPTPKKFGEFIDQELKDSSIEFTDDTQKILVRGFLLDDEFFERNPRHTKRFITSLAFALKSLNAQLSELGGEEGQTNETRISLQEVIDHPDLMAKTLLIQEKAYPVYEKLVLRPDLIVVHEKIIRKDASALLVFDDNSLDIHNDAGKDSPEKLELLRRYRRIISVGPQFTDEKNVTLFDPASFFSFSGATGLPSLKGPDEANFSQYIKSGQLVEQLGSSIQVAPVEKRKRLIDLAKNVLGEVQEEQEKVNVLTENLKMAGLLKEWTDNLNDWGNKVFDLPAERQSDLLRIFFDSALKKNPDFIGPMLDNHPETREGIWIIVPKIKDDELYSTARATLKQIIEKSFDVDGVEPDLKGANVYANRFGIEDLTTVLDNQMKHLDTMRGYLDSLSGMGVTEGPLVEYVLDRMKTSLMDLASLEWLITHQDFLKSRNILDDIKQGLVKKQLSAEDLVKFSVRTEQLALSADEISHLVGQIERNIKVSATIDFVQKDDGGDIQNILFDPKNKLRVFTVLTRVFVSKNEAVAKRQAAADYLAKKDELWGALSKDDVYNDLKNINGLRVGNSKEWNKRKNAILRAWGYNDVANEELTS